MVDCSVIVVSYDTSALTLQCLASLRASVGVAVDVVVVDNASSDGSAAAVAEAFPDVTLLANPTNVGFARAVNQGLGRATGRSVLLMNPDATVEPETIARLVAVLDADPSLAAVGPLITSPDGSVQHHCASRELSVARQLAWHLRLPTAQGGLYLGAPCGPFGARRTERLSGAALAVRREIVQKVGPLDERFFLFFEDADWLRRMRRSGYAVACVTEAKVVHRMGASSAGRPQRRSLHALDSELAYFRKHDGPVGAMALRCAIAAIACARACTIDAARAVSRRGHQRLHADWLTLKRCLAP